MVKKETYIEISENMPADEFKIPALYDDYDYASFWEGRYYEDASDKMAVMNLLERIPLPHHRIADIGAGMGRLVPLYENGWEECVLADASAKQLAIAKKRMMHPEKAELVHALAEDVPLPAGYCDAAICVRVFHYVADAPQVVRELARIIRPGGYLILEMPNKLHFKAKVAAFFKGTRRSLAARGPLSLTQADMTFVNHHPADITELLAKNGLDIREVLSVSNFRSPIFKQTIPHRLLIYLESRLQKYLGRNWFGPSIYFLAKKRAN